MIHLSYRTGMYAFFAAACIVSAVLLAARLGGDGVAIQYGQVSDEAIWYAYVDVERGLLARQATPVEALLYPNSESARDGRTVVARREGGNVDLYMLERDGSRRRLTHFSDFPLLHSERAGRRANQYPSWSPDGAWIAFISADVNGRLSLYALQPAGNGLRRLGEHIRVSAPFLPRWVSIHPGFPFELLTLLGLMLLLISRRIPRSLYRVLIHT
jgi:hypothetical protein